GIRDGHVTGVQTCALPISLEWLEARQQIFAAQKQYEDPKSPSRILLICGSPRTDETCPSEISKSFRIAKTAKTVMDAELGFQIRSEERRVGKECRTRVWTR